MDSDAFWRNAAKHYWKDFELAALRDVYLPAEDSELLCQEALKRAHGRVLDMGCGSGIVGIVCAKKDEVKEVACCDISPSAVKCAKINAEKNGVEGKIKFYKGNLFDALPENSKKFDLILFNPPYLPTGASEKVHGRLNDALDGGKEGIEIAEKFIKKAGGHLANGGLVLMLCSTAQNLEKLAATAKKAGFAVEVAATQNLFFEQLMVWELERR